MPSSTQKPNLTGALAWSSDGNVGIGTNAPGRKLDVEGDGRFVQVQAATTGAITLRQNIGDTVGGHIQWVNNANIVEKGWLAVDTSSNMIFATQSAERLRIDSNGKVGVGTISDVAVVDIAGDGVSVGTPATVGGPQLRVSQASPTGYGGIQFGKTPTPSTSLGWHLVSELSGSFHFYSGTWGYGQYRVGISAAGNVGIGVVAPSSKLDVAGDITLGADFSGSGTQQLIFRGANTDYAKIRFESAGDAAGQSGLIFETWDNANEPFVFRQSGNERLRIDVNGNVGIGTQFPGQKLTVAGTVESTSGGFKFPDGSVQTTAGSSGIGTGQTWQQVSRAVGTTYTNTTGKPIMLVATCGRNGWSTAGFKIIINGSYIPLSYNTNSGGGNRSVGSIIIPPAATYQLYVWSEPIDDYEVWELR